MVSKPSQQHIKGLIDDDDKAHGMNVDSMGMDVESTPAVLRAERGCTEPFEQEGGVGAAGRFTSFSEIDRVLQVGVPVDSRRLDEMIRSLPGVRGYVLHETELELNSEEWVSQARTFTDAVLEARSRRRPLFVAVLCFREHENHRARSLNVWNDLISSKEVSGALRKHFVCWAVGLHGEQQCCALHKILSVHAVPVGLLFIVPQGRTSLVDTVAFDSIEERGLVERLNHVMESYAPFLSFPSQDEIDEDRHALLERFEVVEALNVPLLWEPIEIPEREYTPSMTAPVQNGLSSLRYIPDNLFSDDNRAIRN